MKDETTPKEVRDGQLKGILCPPVKLKDGMSPTFNLKKIFGFVPEKILVIKVASRNNWFQLFAVFTEEALGKIAEAEKERENTEKSEILKLNKKDE